MNYFINEDYKYPKSNRVFKLKKVTKDKFKFYCGHWCFESVFLDLIRVKTGIQVYKDLQLQLKI